jgi:glycosyl transferase family 87
MCCARPASLLSSRGLRFGALSSGVAALGLANGALAHLGDRYVGGLFNDFFDYWAAARILNRGGDPYDAGLMARVVTEAKIHSTVGDFGYSYPLLLAEGIRPLALLPPVAAAVLFTLGSLACLGLAVALLVSARPTAWRHEALGLAVLAGLFVPTVGTLYYGQVNLYLLPPLVLAYLGIGRSGWLAVASAVKLFPAAAIVAFVALGRRGVRPALAAGAGVVALAMLPNLATPTRSYGAGLVAMFGPDTFWSNQSINGFVSRLALPSDWTRPPLPGLPVTALMVTACALLGAVLLFVVRRPEIGWPGAFALLLCYGVVAAPKNSLWNFAPLLIVAFHSWTLAGERRRDLALLALSIALLNGQPAFEAVRGLLPSHPPVLSWASSLPLYGALLLTGLLVHQLASPAARARPELPRAA